MSEGAFLRSGRSGLSRHWREPPQLAARLEEEAPHPPRPSWSAVCSSSPAVRRARRCWPFSWPRDYAGPIRSLPGSARLRHPVWGHERLDLPGDLKCLGPKLWISLLINLWETWVVHADLGKPGTPIWVSVRVLSTPIWVSRTPIWVRKHADLGKLGFRKCLSEKEFS